MLFRSAMPSSQPSAAPSSNPSSEPSLQPSRSPSHNTSLAPSDSPSSLPSLSPSASPSAAPSVDPSDGPSAAPSASPSSSPSVSAAPSDPLPTCYASVVKIQSVTSQALQFYEVQVISGGTNVALQGTATQSSELGGATEAYKASNAIDGSNSTFSHTESLPNQCLACIKDVYGTFITVPVYARSNLEYGQCRFL